MLEKNYINKNVIVEEKLYNQIPSSLQGAPFLTAAATSNKLEGRLTNIDDDFIELDNKMLISRQHIYRIMLKESND